MNKKSIIKQLLVLEFGVYKKSPMYIFLSFILSLVLGVIWLIIRVGDPTVIPSTIACLSITNTTLVFWRSLASQKQSQIYRRLRYNKVSVLVHIFSIMLFNLIINTCGMLLIFALGMCFVHQWQYLHLLNLLNFLASYFLFWLTCILFSYLIFTLTQGGVLAQIIITAFHMITYNLLGCSFPFYSIVNIKWVNNFLYLMPNRYALNLMQATYMGANNFNYIDNIYGGKYNLNWKIGNNMGLIYGVVCLIILALFLMLGIYFFVEQKQRRTKMGSFAETRNYLQKIKKAQSIEEVKSLQNLWDEKNK